MGPKRTSSREAHVLEGRYANFFKVGYNSAEFIIDFGQCYSGNDQAELYTRIITSPEYAKSLLETLRSAVKQYETKIRTIPGEEEP